VSCRDVVALFATTLATKVSWDASFEVVDAVALGPSPWATRLQRVLRTPHHGCHHRQYIAESDRAGTAASF
jgi:hypothetical protein